MESYLQHNQAKEKKAVKCVSPRTDQSDSSIINKLAEKLDPTDLMIMTVGAWLGYHGWTPITSLINIAKGVIPSVESINYGIGMGLSPIPFAWQDPIGQFIGLLTGGKKPDEETSEEEKKDIHDRYLLAGVGMIEAYALTRPGTIGSILQGIGEIVPL